jgi:hypothetical protein
VGIMELKRQRCLIFQRWSRLTDFLYQRDGEIIAFGERRKHRFRFHDIESVMAKSDPTKDAEFKRILGNLMKAPPKPHSEMKLGKAIAKKL